MEKVGGDPLANPLKAAVKLEEPSESSLAESPTKRRKLDHNQGNEDVEPTKSERVKGVAPIKPESAVSSWYLNEYQAYGDQISCASTWE